MANISFEPITPEIGACVHVDAADVTADGVPAQILDALDRYNVLVFPEVHMSDDQFLAMTDALGENHDLGATDDKTETSSRGVYRIALDKDDKTQLEFVRGNDFWHIDGTVYDTPGKATLLKCENPPSEGGDTGFANLKAAYEALPQERKDALRGLEVVHCLAAVGRKLYDEPSDDDFARWDSIFPDTPHPLVWRQRDGRCTLVIGATADRITGMSRENGAKLIAELNDWCTQDRFTYRHKWKKGDVVIFNNPGLMHRSYPYDERAGRLMHRTTLKGIEPIAAAA